MTVAEVYACAFPRMIEAWRAAWAAGTGGHTDAVFPFGFVQLSTWGPWGQPTKRTDRTDHPIAVLRFAQTADVGYVPNAAMPNTFMATAVDLGAYEGGCGKNTYPSLCIHPGWKQEVGRRLHLGALDRAYNRTATYWTGPIFACASHWAASPSTVKVTFRSTGAGGVTVQTSNGFELDMDGSGTWVAAPITTIIADGASMLIQVPTHATAVAGAGAGAAGGTGARVRYLWNNIPCVQHNNTIGSCAVYAKAEGLPAPPFIADVGTAPC